MEKNQEEAATYCRAMPGSSVCDWTQDDVSLQKGVSCLTYATSWWRDVLQVGSWSHSNIFDDQLAPCMVPQA